MPKILKEEIKDSFIKRAKELELGGKAFLTKIADEATATTEEGVLEFITKAEHPVTAMEPMF
jgi:CO dehydrogenase/acetyl-CoA synthase beta subunit